MTLDTCMRWAPEAAVVFEGVVGEVPEPEPDSEVEAAGGNATTEVIVEVLPVVVRRLAGVTVVPLE